LYYEKESGALNFWAGLAIGALVGASIALLTAPQSGKRTRRKLTHAVREGAEDGWDSVAAEVRRKLRQRRRRMRG
jgi:gas vesicle protein